MNKKNRIRYRLGVAKRKYAPGAARNAEYARIGRAYDLSTGGGPLRGLAMFSKGGKYW
jgi:hypothetical protein